MIQANLVIQTRFIAEFDKDEFVGEPVEFRAPSCPGHVRGQSPRQTSSWLDSNSISTVSVMKIIVRDYWHRKGGSWHRKKHMFDPRHRFSREGAHGVDKNDDPKGRQSSTRRRVLGLASCAQQEVQRPRVGRGLVASSTCGSPPSGAPETKPPCPRGAVQELSIHFKSGSTVYDFHRALS